MNNEEKAAVITDRLFSPEMGYSERPHRIQFKLGTYPDNERSGGGMCREAFQMWLAHQLEQLSNCPEAD